MKTVSMIAAAAVLVVGSFAQAKLVKVSDAEAAELKKALVIPELDNCSGMSEFQVKRAIGYSQNVYVEDAGAQPAVVLYYAWNNNSRAKITVTTSADFRSIVQVKVEEQSLTNVNYGTLIKPKVVAEFKTDATFKCQGAR